MKYCPSCGQPCDEAQKFCNNCGAPFSGNEQAPQYANAPVPTAYAPAPAEYAPRVTTKKEFLELPGNQNVKREIKTSAIICYVCAGITLAAGIALDGFPSVLIDVAILVGMGLGIHLAQSRVCAVILLLYSLVNMIYSIVVIGRPAGYLVVIAGVYAVIYTFKADKLWKQYQTGG